MGLNEEKKIQELDWLKSIGEFDINDESVHIAIGYEKLNDTVHIGIIYKEEFLEPRFYHLAFHCHFRNDDLAGIKDRYKIIKVKIHPTRIQTIGGVLGSIASNHFQLQNGIKYGLGFSGNGTITFDPSTGTIKGEYIGLTCATFVLTIFDYVGMYLLDTNQWKNKNDFYGNCKLIDLLNKYKVDCNISEEHIEQNRRNIGSPRYKPEEVAAASYFYPPPATFEFCALNGNKILNEILPSDSLLRKIYLQ